MVNSPLDSHDWSCCGLDHDLFKRWFGMGAPTQSPDYQSLVSLNQTLLNPYFWAGVG